MAPKRSHARDSTPKAQTPSADRAPSQSPAAQARSSSSSSTPTPSRTGTTTTTAAAAPATKSSSRAATRQQQQSPAEIAVAIWKNYVDKTSQRTKLIDVFMAFLVAVGALQFVYCVLVGNYPFNAFLSGFSATVGQFVLTASLRIQTNPENKAEFYQISHERAFADYVFGSLILHFFCINFIN